MEAVHAVYDIFEARGPVADRDGQETGDKGYVGGNRGNPFEQDAHDHDGHAHHAPPDQPMLRHLTFGRPGVAEAPVMCLAPIVLTTVGCFVLFFYADRIRLFLEPVFGG